MGNHFSLVEPLPASDLDAIEEAGMRYFNADAWPEEAIQRNLQAMMDNPYCRRDPEMAANLQEGIQVVGLRGVWQEWLDTMKEDFKRQRPAAFVSLAPDFIGWSQAALEVVKRDMVVVAQPVE